MKKGEVQMENMELELASALDTKKVEENLLTEKKVTEEEVEKSLNYDELSDEEKKAIDELIFLDFQILF